MALALITHVILLTVSLIIMLGIPYLISTVEPFVRISLDHYPFIAITASSSTLCDLIKMVELDNNRRQQEMDETGYDAYRKLDVSTFLSHQHLLICHIDFIYNTV